MTARTFPRRSSRPRVLMYHAVDSRSRTADPDNLFVPVEAFARQLDLLEAAGLTPCGLDAYLDGTAGPRSVLLTFDDAYVSTLERAAPLLAERGWPAVVYAASRTLGSTSTWNHCADERLLDGDELRELVRLGFTVGAHSRTHVDLRGLSARDLESEVVGAADDLEELLGVRPRSFAHPFGGHDDAVRALVERHYALGFAVHAGAGPAAVPRIDVNAADTDRTFRLKLWPGYRAVRKGLSAAPPLRRAVHRLVGEASR